MTTPDAFGSQRLRRVDADRADLYGDPNVIASSKHLIAPNRDCDSQSNIITMANDPLNSDTTSSEGETSLATTPMSTPPVTTSSDFAFAFDIDGVLVRGGKPIPEAVQAMKYINGENPYGVRV